MIEKNVTQKGLLIFTILLILPMLIAPAAFSNVCKTDMNWDNQVDFDDMEILEFEFGRNDCYSKPCQADLNNDGKVNNEDVKILGAEFGRVDFLDICWRVAGLRKSSGAGCRP